MSVPIQRIADRSEPMINGALIALGAMAVVDNVVAHWIFGLHRAIPGPWALHVEVVLVGVGVLLVALGVWRERHARRCPKQ